MPRKKEEQQVVKPQGNRNIYQQFGSETKSSNIEGSLLLFTKHGDWVAGQERDEVAEGTELILGVNTIKKGWQKWEDQKPVEFHMGLLSEGYVAPLRDELGDTDEDQWEEMPDGKKRDPWQKSAQCQLLDPKTKEVYTFASNSKGGFSALGEISGAYGDRIQDGEDEDEMPIVALQRRDYDHSVYGQIFVPVFELTGKWVKPPPTKAKPQQTRGKAEPQRVNRKAAGSPQSNGRAKPKALAPPPKKPGSGRGARI